MESNGTQLDHTGPAGSKYYWYSQLAGWSIYIVFEFFLMLALSGRKTNVPVMATKSNPAWANL